jgi:hypothetical protein
MDRWEYRFVRVEPNHPHASEELNALGRDRWRVIHVAALANDPGAVHVLFEREQTTARPPGFVEPPVTTKPPSSADLRENAGK